MSISLVKGDITKLDVDVIVNAANNSLLGGGGVDGAIHRAGGPAILQECIQIRNKQGGCPTGEAVITTGGKLKAKYVIHAVGPVWYGGEANEDVLLANSYRNSLKLADSYQSRSIAFPNISTGIYGFPKKRAAEIAIREIRLFLTGEHHYTKDITFCCFDDENYQIYKGLLA
ncbi:MAG TPA: O-acetyl-ADP-ribose deacetylase [Cyclobacteriaceae bacterium]|nr:O-acetyl-ADP-ribose deacetylase [Cyclobacteriaceae bacterium]